MLLNLKIKILESRRRQYQIAHAVGWHPTKLSAIINGSQKPSEIDQELLAQEIGCRVEDIFPPSRKATLA